MSEQVVVEQTPVRGIRNVVGLQTGMLYGFLDSSAGYWIVKAYSGADEFLGVSSSYDRAVQLVMRDYELNSV